MGSVLGCCWQIAAMTNCHKPDGLKQPNLSSYSSGDQKSGITFTELRVSWHGWIFFLKVLGQKLFPCFL